MPRILNHMSKSQAWSSCLTSTIGQNYLPSEHSTNIFNNSVNKHIPNSSGMQYTVTHTHTHMCIRAHTQTHTQKYMHPNLKSLRKNICVSVYLAKAPSALFSLPLAWKLCDIEKSWNCGFVGWGLQTQKILSFCNLLSVLYYFHVGLINSWTATLK